MSRIADVQCTVTGGVDTHAELNVAAVVDHVGRVLGTEQFPATTAGHGAVVAWMRGYGTIAKVGVEGTGSYGVGLARYLTAQSVEVTEVVRPNRQARRRRGKSDAADAVAAALAALGGEASSRPKSHDGAVESIRALRVARRGAIKARTQAANQLHGLIIAAPDQLRERLVNLPAHQRVELAAGLCPATLVDLVEPAEGTKAAMATVARRHQELTEEITRLDTMLEKLVASAAPKQFLAKFGVSTQTASALLITIGDNPHRLRSDASFAALCGASPVDASSGKQIRHRLNRGGDREANSALWRIVMVRMAHDPRTKAYLARRTAEGKTNREVMRCLKRYVAREVYKALATHTDIAQRPRRPADRGRSGAGRQTGGTSPAAV